MIRICNCCASGGPIRDRASLCRTYLSVSARGA